MLVAAPTKSSEFWYPDGSLILRTSPSPKLFRVHLSVLAQHSSVFQDMQRMPQPSESARDEVIDGCPVVDVQDDPTDITYVLRTLYNPTYLLQECIPLPAIAALLRLGRKYELSREISDAAIQRLTFENPRTLQAYDALLSPTGSYIPTRITPYPGIRLDMLALAREYDLTHVLPCAYFRVATQYPRESLFDGIPRKDREGTTAHLAPADLRLCLLAHEKMMRVQFREGYVLGWLQYGDWGKDCKEAERCTRTRAGTLRSYTSKHLSASILMSPQSLDLALQALCEPCRERAERLMREGREKAWGELPGFFGLMAWGDVPPVIS